jgi:hypothetical protein
MLAYSAYTAINFRDEDGFLSGIGDLLFSSIPHVSRAWNKNDIEQFVEIIRAGDSEKARRRAALYQVKKDLRSKGLKVKELPWGISVEGQQLSDSEWSRIGERLRSSDE